jgi:predicted dienelactone hydrolase
MITTIDASAAGNPFQRGPNPTAQALEADSGPFQVARMPADSGNGFLTGTITYPIDTGQGTFGAVAVSPGFLEAEDAVYWFGARLASHGFVVLTINTNSQYDQPDARGTQLLAALDYLTTKSPVRNRIDPTRLAVMGHSMGGGGALEAAAKRPTLKAAVPLAPWNLRSLWFDVRVPTMIIGGENDWTAPALVNAELFFHTLGGRKVFLEMKGADHLVTNNPTPTVGKYSVAWLKRFVDDDVRYDQFLCPAPSADSIISKYRNTCPNA